MGPKRAIHHLLTLFALATAVAAGPAFAEEEKWTDWGTMPGLKSPQPDSKGRSGHWWWPELPERGPGKVDSFGNRGRIFGNWNAEPSSRLPVSPEPPSPMPNSPNDTEPVVFLNNIFFPSDIATLQKEGMVEADKLIGVMKKHLNDTVVCVGHTDDVGTEAYNQQLGLCRAQAVVDYMAANGIAPERLRAESRGETEPAVPNDTPANRALNRRVIFEIRYGD